MPNQFVQNEPEVVAEDQNTAQKSFIERGLASRAAAKETGEYVSSDEVLRELDELLVSANKKA